MKCAGDAEFDELVDAEAGDGTTVEGDGALGGLIHAGDEVEDSGLARAVGTDEADEFVFTDGEIDGVDGGEAAETDGGLVELEEGGHGSAAFAEQAGNQNGITTGVDDQIDYGVGAIDHKVYGVGVILEMNSPVVLNDLSTRLADRCDQAGGNLKIAQEIFAKIGTLFDIPTASCGEVVVDLFGVTDGEHLEFATNPCEQLIKGKGGTGVAFVFHATPIQFGQHGGWDR